MSDTRNLFTNWEFSYGNSEHLIVCGVKVSKEWSEQELYCEKEKKVNKSLNLEQQQMKDAHEYYMVQ